MIGFALFSLLAALAAGAVLVIVREMTAPRPVERFQPSGGHPGPVVRPCAVYEIDLTDGRKYIGYGFNPRQRIMQSHRRAAWFKLAVTAGRTFEPDRVDWYPSDQAAHTEEVRRIRAASPKMLVNKILYREGAA